MRFLFLYSILAVGVSADDFVASFSALESAAAVESETPSISLVLDRDVYDLRDTNAIAVVRTSAGSYAADDLSMRVILVRDGTEKDAQILAPAPTPLAELVLDIKTLDPGNYTLQAALRFRSRVIANDEQNFVKRRRQILPPGKKKGRLLLTVPVVAGAVGCSWPVTGAVAFARDALLSTDHVRLVGADDQDVPLQTDVRARWNRDGSIRWLGIEFIATIGETPQAYYLQYDPELPTVEVESALRCYETEEGVAITSGAVHLAMNRFRFRGIDTLFFDANGDHNYVPSERMISESDAAGFFVVDHDGDRYEPVNDPGVKMTLESEGPVRATVRVEAWYVKADTMGMEKASRLPTDALMRLDLRLHMYAGLPLVRLEIVNIVTVDTNDVGIDGLGLTLVPRRPGEIVRSNPEAPASSDWLSIDSQSAAMIAGVRGFAVMQPKELRWTGNLLHVDIWPGRESVSPADGTADEPRALHALHRGKHMQLRGHSNATGQGIAIASDIYLAFRPLRGEGQWSGAQLMSLANQQPPAIMDPKALLATGVLGPMLQLDDEYAALEKNLADEFAKFARIAAPLKGMFVHGAAFDDRQWKHGQDGLATFAFEQYLRSGDPAMLRWARDHTAHVRDLATCHHVSDDVKFPVRVVGARSTGLEALPWSTPMTIRGAGVECLLYDYLITGNPRSKQAVEDWVGALLANELNEAGNYRVLLYRQLLAVWPWTWDARLLDVLDRTGPGTDFELLRQQPDLLVKYYVLRGDEIVLKLKSAIPVVAAVHSLVHDDMPALQDIASWLQETSLADKSCAGFMIVARQYPYILKALHSYGIASP